METRVVIAGLSELRTSLRKLDRELDRELARGLRNEVAKPVADRIRAGVPRSGITSRGRTASGRRARKSHWYAVIRPGVTFRGDAYITWGRASVPYAGWMEFGGRIRMPNRGVTLTRARVRGGRYVYPEVARGRREAVRTTLQIMHRVAARAGLDLK